MMPSIRKNQRNLTASDWQKFIAAINSMHGIQADRPRYREFVDVHVRAMTTTVGMNWSVHSMTNMGMIGRNFLAWHRHYLLQFEKRLQKFDTTVTIPYWDWINDPQPPAPISERRLLTSWSVRRDSDLVLMPNQSQLTGATTQSVFRAFQFSLEQVHGSVHMAVGGSSQVNGGTEGTMSTPSSPADPIFWLHHANIDRIWSEWQAQQKLAGNPNANPTNPREIMLPRPLFGVRVADILDIAILDYKYV